MTEIGPDTSMSDRALLIHLVQHIEAMHDRLEQIGEEFDVFRPLLARFRPAGGADFLTIMQARRELKRGASPRP